MSATTLPRSPEPSVEHDQVHLSLPSSTQSKFKTSERKPASGITLLPRGSSVRRWQEGDVYRVDGYGRGNCEEYIREDIKNRVSVDFEVFMKSVLHVPQDWRIRWSQAIEAIRTDPKFKQYHEEYFKRCANLTSGAIITTASYGDRERCSRRLVSIRFRWHLLRNPPVLSCQ